MEKKCLGNEEKVDIYEVCDGGNNTKTETKNNNHGWKGRGRKAKRQHTNNDETQR